MEWPRGCGRLAGWHGWWERVRRGGVRMLWLGGEQGGCSSCGWEGAATVPRWPGHFLPTWWLTPRNTGTSPTIGAMSGTSFRITWKKNFKLPWREAGPPNHHDDKVDSDQKVVNTFLARFSSSTMRSEPAGFGFQG